MNELINVGYFRKNREAVGNPIFVLSREGKIRSVNRAACELLGYCEDELIGRQIDSILEEDDMPGALELARMAESEELVGIVKSFKAGNGSKRQLAITILVVSTDKGEPQTVIWQGNDILLTKMAKRQLYFIEKAFENAPIGVTVSDINGKIIYTNPEEAKIHEMTISEIVGQDVSIFIPPEFRDQLTRSRIIRQERWARESVNVTKNGDRFPVQLYSSAVYDNEKLIGIVTTCEDISERKLEEVAQRNLSSLVHFLHHLNQISSYISDRRKLADNICQSFIDLCNYLNVSIVLTDENGGNDLFCDAGADNINEPIEKMRREGSLPPCVKKSFLLSDVAQVLDPESECVSCPVVGICKKGQTLTFALEQAGNSYGQLLLSVPKDVGLGPQEQTIFREIAGHLSFTLHRLFMEEKQRRANELERMRQRKLKQADRIISLGVIATGIAHEINNPNQFILNNAIMLEGICADSQVILDRYYKEMGDFKIGGSLYSEVRDKMPLMIGALRSGSDRITNIIREVQKFARVDPESSYKLVRLDEIVQSAITLLSRFIRETTDSLILDFENDLPSFEGDYQQIEQVVINLIKNACQALPDRSSTIRIKTARDDERGEIVLKVSDEGHGIEEELLNHITDPFYSTKHGDQGLGLGLSICLKIATSHQGSLTFSSTLGKGTTATVRLPIMQERIAVNEQR
jgi:PAS domain S-box-containing protein